MRDGTLKKPSASRALFMVYGDDIGWFGCMRVVFQKTKQVGFCFCFVCIKSYASDRERAEGGVVLVGLSCGPQGFLPRTLATWRGSLEI